ncbi:putative pollen allergen Ole e 1 family [Helianthus debilis subsp. tardiflorus]
MEVVCPIDAQFAHEICLLLEPPSPLQVQDDPAIVGFWTFGAKVRVECKDRTQKLLYTAEGTTDATGTYYINVNEDHGDETCDVALVSSPLGDCKTADPGRDCARVVLTSYNGIVSDSRFANAMGFMKDEVMSGCTTLLQSLMEEED